MTRWPKDRSRGRGCRCLACCLKLRQVCCHPKLFLPDYEGTSGKLELLVQTVQQATLGKRRILIFSQFVGMLQIIRKRLAREGIKTLYLDGSTKPEVRQELCDRFNGGEGQVFLISLKAGGTGLNLTGADLVIHLRPVGGTPPWRIRQQTAPTVSVRRRMWT